MTPDPNDKHFGPVPFPPWVKEFRETQWDKIEEVMEEFRYHDVVFLQAPTGTGKSLIGETVRRLSHTNSVYCCTTKALQDQFAEDFPYAKVVKGRGNYLTESGKLNELGLPTKDRYSAITCADCTYNPRTNSCRWCYMRGTCPYTVAKTRAAQAELAVVNTSFLLTDFTVGSHDFLNRGLIIIDEADMLESELLNHVEVDISEARRLRMALELPTRKTVSRAWREWAEDEAIPKIEEYLDFIPKPWEQDTDAKAIREYFSSAQLLNKIKDIAPELEEGGWIYDGYNDERNPRITFRPIRVDQYGDIVWGNANKFLLMSASILSPDLMAEDLGLAGTTYGFVDVPSGFPIANRPVFVIPVANMTFKTQDAEYPKLLKAILSLLKLHPGQRILIHTVSYNLARRLDLDIRAGLDGVDSRPVVTYTESAGKSLALDTYKKYPDSVMVAPSMDRGIDLPGDLCRVQIIAKVPYPSLGDKRIAARMHSPGGTEWYRMQTVRTIIQMTGRAVRSETDSATTYILDSQFQTNLYGDAHLFPDWWNDAVRWDFPRRKLL